MSDTWRFPTHTGDPSDLHTTWSQLHYSIDYVPDFRCKRCIHYKGGCECDLGIYIYAEGVDMSVCLGFEEGKVCRHCGKRT